MEDHVAVVATSAKGGVLSVWDCHVGKHLQSYKDNSSCCSGLTLLGRDYVVAAQSPKGALHFWTWHRDPVLQRCFAVEPLVALAASPDGLWLAGGSPAGTVYLWETPSGRLLTSWPAHYKENPTWAQERRAALLQGVRALAFSGDGAWLVSGGEDTVVHAWGLLRLLSPPSGPPAAPAPLHTWAEHMLPVTSVWCGAGTGSPLLLSASLDCSLRVRSLTLGTLLLSVTLPSPLLCVAADPGEHAAYAGAANGAVYQVPLLPAGSSPSWGPGALEGGPPGLGAWQAWEGHAGPVTCLATGSGEHLLSGGEDGVVRVWEARSGQVVRTLPAPAKGPITGLLLVPRPPHLAASRAQGEAASGSGQKGPRRPQPLAPLCTYPGLTGSVAPWEGAPLVLDGSAPSRSLVGESGLAAAVSPPEEAALPGPSGATAAATAHAAEGQEAGSLMEKLAAVERRGAELERELQAAQGSCRSWQELHRQLHTHCVEALLAPGD